MKAISLWQPWASAITLGLKHIETRGWATTHRGPLAIHAAKRWTPEERDTCTHFARLHGLPELADPPRGAIIGVANIVAVLPSEALEEGLSETERSFGNYGPGRFGWLLEDVVAFRVPIPYRGMQGLFNVPDAIIDEAVADTLD